MKKDNKTQQSIYISYSIVESFSNTFSQQNSQINMTQLAGGLKGFFQRAGKSFSQAGGLTKDWSYWLAGYGARFGLFLASTSMVVLMPLIFEINREVQVGLTEFQRRERTGKHNLHDDSLNTFVFIFLPDNKDD
jgi:hypothetical protein